MSYPVETVCVIDDDEIYRFTAKREIENTQMVQKVIFFPDGFKAICFIKDEVSNPNQLPDVVFLDVNMPVMDGWEFLEEYSHIKPELAKPIVIYMVSSSVDERDKSRANKISAVTGYIVKPIGRDRLRDIFTMLNPM